MKKIRRTKIIVSAKRLWLTRPALPTPNGLCPFCGQLIENKPKVKLPADGSEQPAGFIAQSENKNLRRKKDE